MLNLTCLSTDKAHLQHLAESNVTILGKSKNLNINETEISQNVSLIRYYFVRVFTYSTGYMQINAVLSSASLSSC